MGFCGQYFEDSFGVFFCMGNIFDYLLRNLLGDFFWNRLRAVEEYLGNIAGSLGVTFWEAIGIILGNPLRFCCNILGDLLGKILGTVWEHVGNIWENRFETFG